MKNSYGDGSGDRRNKISYGDGFGDRRNKNLYGDGSGGIGKIKFRMVLDQRARSIGPKPLQSMGSMAVSAMGVYMCNSN